MPAPKRAVDGWLPFIPQRQQCRRKHELRHPSGVLCKYRRALSECRLEHHLQQLWYGATRKKSITVPRLIIATFRPVLLAIEIRFKIAAKVIVVTGCLFARDSSKPLRAYVALRAVTHIKPNHSHGQLNFGENRCVLQLGNFYFP